MKIITDLESILLRNPVVTIGTFDGLHLGHLKVLQKLIQVAQEQNGESVVFTFVQHPRIVLYPNENNIKLLTTFQEKTDLFDQSGLDYMIAHEFTKEFSQLSSEDFIVNYLVKIIKVKNLIIGYDHQFGRNREGEKGLMQKLANQYNFNIIDVTPYSIDTVNVSSTKIRNALINGNIILANQYLGRNYTVCGIVVEGKKVGRTIGFPTANVQILDDSKLIPMNGVYAVKVIIEGIYYNAMLNIGNRPTFEENLHNTTIEAHIFNFDLDIYNQKICICFINRIRDEIKFNNIEELILQLNKDKKQVSVLLTVH